MTASWQRVLDDGVHCGGCGADLENGAHVYVIELSRTRRLVRGPCCRGEAPPALPARVEAVHGRTKRMTPLTRTAQAVVQQFPQRTRTG